MSIAGAGFGAAKALEEILGEQMLRAQMAQREREQAERMALEQQRFAESQRQFNVRADADDRQRRDVNNRQGLELMQSDKAQMDTDAAITGLPGHLKPLAGLMRIGALRNLSTDDLKTPEQKAQEAKAAEESEIRVRRASIAPRSDSAANLTLVDDKGNQQRVPDGPQANQMLQQGWKIFDAVAARSSKPADSPEARDTANEAARLAQALLDHKGFGGVFGLHGSYLPTVRQDTADAEQLLGSLTGLLTVENMDKMRGVLSDSDMKVLRAASTTLSNRMGDQAAASELKRIVEVMKRAGGQGAAAGLPPMDLATSRGKAPAPAPAGDDIDALIERLRKPKR